MTGVQASEKNKRIFNFLTKFSNPHDVKIILDNIGFDISLFKIILIAFKLWRGVPVAKIINKKWFYGLPFYTNKYTLDPRPDSETLVEAVLKDLQTEKQQHQTRILDLGTGTGCLLIAILKNFPNIIGVGIDKSQKACIVAQKNVNSLGLKDKIKIIHSSFISYLKYHASQYDIIIANPPYIPRGDKGMNRGALHDPKMALYGGKDGLRYYKEIAEALHHVKHSSKLFLEIGVGQENSVRKILDDAHWTFLSGYKDLAGKTRVLSFKNF